MLEQSKSKSGIKKKSLQKKQNLLHQPCFHSWEEKQLKCCKKFVCRSCGKMWMDRNPPFETEFRTKIFRESYGESKIDKLSAIRDQLLNRKLIKQLSLKNNNSAKVNKGQRRYSFFKSPSGLYLPKYHLGIEDQFPLSSVSAFKNGVRSTVNTGGVMMMGVPAVGGCDSCTGALTLSHHFENVDCTLGSPCGCTTGASNSLTLGTGASISADTGTGWPSDGTNSLKIGSTATTIPMTWDKTEGTLSFDVYCSTFEPSVTILYWGDLVGGDYLKVEMMGSDSVDMVAVTMRSGAGIPHQFTSAAFAFDGTKASIAAKWDTDVAHSGHYMSLTVDAATVYYDTQPTAAEGTYTVLNAGINNSSTCYLDNLKLYNTWQ